MDNGFDLNVKVWKLIEGEIEELKYDGKRNDRLNSHIVSLIDKKMISQMGNNKFKVNRRK